MLPTIPHSNKHKNYIFRYNVKYSIQFKCICIALFTIYIVSKQLYRKCISEMYMENCKYLPNTKEGQRPTRLYII